VWFNAISKSGTNAFHGDLYEFLRNEKTGCERLLFKCHSQPNGQPQAKAPYKRNQFGAAAGGPISQGSDLRFRRLRRIRQRQGVAVPATVPSNNARLGILADPNNPGKNLPAFTGTCPANSTLLDPAAAVCVDNSVAKYLALYPHANGPVNGNKGFFTYPGLRSVREDFFTTRVDHRISDKDSLFGTYMYERTPYTQPDVFNNLSILSKTTRQIVALERNPRFSPAWSIARGSVSTVTSLLTTNLPRRLIQPPMTFLWAHSRRG